MIHGTASKLSDKTIASATSIKITADIIRLSGSTTVTHIVPAWGGQFAQTVLLYGATGNVPINDTGNINTGGTVTQVTPLVAVRLVFNPKLAKWTL